MNLLKRIRIHKPRIYGTQALHGLAAGTAEAMLIGGGGVIGPWRYSTALSAWVPNGTQELENADSDTFSGLITDHIGGGSTYSWSSGLSVTDETRLSIQMFSSSLARANLTSITVNARWESITLSGSLGASSRPRWLVGVRGALRAMNAGVANDGTAWEVGNEFGAVAAPSLQSAITVPGFATGITFVSSVTLIPRQSDTNTAYILSAGTGAASGEGATWDGTAAETIVADPPYTEIYLSCLDSDVSTTPGGVLKTLTVVIEE